MRVTLNRVQLCRPKGRFAAGLDGARGGGKGKISAVFLDELDRAFGRASVTLRHSWHAMALPVRRCSVAIYFPPRHAGIGGRRGRLAAGAVCERCWRRRPDAGAIVGESDQSQTPICAGRLRADMLGPGQWGCTGRRVLPGPVLSR